MLENQGKELKENLAESLKRGSEKEARLDQVADELVGVKVSWNCYYPVQESSSKDLPG